MTLDHTKMFLESDKELWSRVISFLYAREGVFLLPIMEQDGIMAKKER